MAYRFCVRQTTDKKIKKLIHGLEQILVQCGYYKPDKGRIDITALQQAFQKAGLEKFDRSQINRIFVSKEIGLNIKRLIEILELTDTSVIITPEDIIIHKGNHKKIKQLLELVAELKKS